MKIKCKKNSENIFKLQYFYVNELALAQTSISLPTTSMHSKLNRSENLRTTSCLSFYCINN